jgi:hypothetical protein
MTMFVSHAKGNCVSGYIHEKILSEVELKEARDLAKSVEFYRVYQMYNLFDVDRADPERSTEYGFIKTLLKHSRYENLVGFYFLRYIPGSFTRMHQDNNTALTIVTMLDQEGLVGGHSIVTNKYLSRERPANQCCERADYEKDNPPYNQDIILDVLPMKDGDSLVYGADQKHAVSKVYEGSRTVLITWFNNERDEKKQ